MDSNGYTGKALDGTGVYFTDEELNSSQSILEGDRVAIEFLDYETIFSVKKIENK